MVNKSTPDERDFERLINNTLKLQSKAFEKEVDEMAEKLTDTQQSLF